MRAWLAALLDLIYPPKCPVCRAPVDEHGVWCPTCLKAVMAVRELSMAEHRLCYLDSCLAICSYTAGMKRLLHDMKFRKMKKYARHLTWALERGLSSAGHVFTGIDAIIPVPLHADRLAERSYNQTFLIFKPWADNRGATLAGLCLAKNKANGTAVGTQFAGAP